MTDKSDKSSIYTKDSDSDNTQSNIVAGNIVDRHDHTKDDWNISYAKGAIVGAVMLAAGSAGAMKNESDEYNISNYSHTIPFQVIRLRESISQDKNTYDDIINQIEIKSDTKIPHYEDPIYLAGQVKSYIDKEPYLHIPSSQAKKYLNFADYLITNPILDKTKEYIVSSYLEDILEILKY